MIERLVSAELKDIRFMSGLEPVLFCRHNSAVFNLMNTESATPNHPGCCGTACARIAKQKYVPHEAWMEAYSFHIAFCHRPHNVLCFVPPSCCTAAGSEPVALLHCRIQSHTAWLLTMNRCCIVYLHLIRSFVRSVDQLNTNYGRSGIVAERPILIPSIYRLYLVCIYIQYIIYFLGMGVLRVY